MLGLVGDRLGIAKKIKDLCKVFLAEKLDVQLSDDKTKITNVTKNYVRFLGVDIKRPRLVGGESKRVSYSPSILFPLPSPLAKHTPPPKRGG